MSDINNFERFHKELAEVKPSPRQLEWYRNPFYAFCHFGMNTATGREWGEGTEDPQWFNPRHLDCDQWVRAVKSAGMTGMVLTAKHHDGFCLWPSKYTEHSVKNSPYKNGKGDIVAEAAEACRRGGIRFGFYLSPWDRNSALYGTEEYNDYYKAQLTELLTGYGEIFHVWFDGACGEGKSGRKQEYDFQGYIELVRKYQPKATIFHDCGPDVRWIGNESGTCRHAEWAVVPCELAKFARVQTGSGYAEGDISGAYNTWQNLGGEEVIRYSKGMCFCPAEVDMSIRPGWFYHENEEPHSVQRLLNTYMTSVGGNAGFNLNVPPMADGRLDERDVKRLKELGAAIENAFSQPVPFKAERIDMSPTQLKYRVNLEEPADISYITLGEDIEKGQLVEAFRIEKEGEFGNTDVIYEGTVIGNKRICRVNCKNTSELEITVQAARGYVSGLKIEIYK